VARKEKEDALQRESAALSGQAGAETARDSARAEAQAAAARELMSIKRAEASEAGKAAAMKSKSEAHAVAEAWKS